MAYTVPYEEISSHSSIVKTINSKGPRTLPWGTPNFTVLKELKAPFTVTLHSLACFQNISESFFYTNCFLFDKKHLMFNQVKCRAKVRRTHPQLHSYIKPCLKILNKSQIKVIACAKALYKSQTELEIVKHVTKIIDKVLCQQMLKYYVE